MRARLLILSLLFSLDERTTYFRFIAQDFFSFSFFYLPLPYDCCQLLYQSIGIDIHFFPFAMLDGPAKTVPTFIRRLLMLMISRLLNQKQKYFIVVETNDAIKLGTNCATLCLKQGKVLIIITEQSLTLGFNDLVSILY